MSALTCVRGCTQDGRHAPTTCTDGQCVCNLPTDAEGPHPATCYATCNGCLPRPTEPKSLVCARCTAQATTALADLADLWAWLGDTRTAQTYSSSGGGGSVASDPEACPDCDTGRVCARTHRGDKQLLGDGARRARSAIRSLLAEWAWTLTQPPYNVTLPVEDTIAATTRRLTSWHRDLAAQARTAAEIARHPLADGSPADPREVQVLKTEELRHLKAGEQAQDDRETGRDIIAALAEHLRRQLDKLLNDDEHADQLVTDLNTAARTARRLLPGGGARVMRIRCSCGERVAIDPTEIMTCRGCGAWGVVSWWIAREAPTVQGKLNAYDLAAWLLVHEGIDLGANGADRIRQWAVRYPEELPREGADTRGRTLFDRTRASIIARRMTRPTQRPSSLAQ